LFDKKSYFCEAILFFQPNQMKQKPKKNAKIEPLEEGVDYYVENGFWVFTAYYHQKRGYCCQNGCRHCPYGFKKRI
jgi:hypothetical protein